MDTELKLTEIGSDDFARRFAMRASNLMWLLGAGASASGGIPTAMDMIWEFKQKRYVSQRRVSSASVEDLSNPPCDPDCNPTLIRFRVFRRMEILMNMHRYLKPCIHLRSIAVRILKQRWQEVDHLTDTWLLPLYAGTTYASRLDDQFRRTDSRCVCEDIWHD